METQIVLSDHIEATPVAPGQTVNTLFNPTLALAVPTVPNNLSFSVTVLTKDMDFDRDQNITFSILGEDDNVLNQIQANIQPQKINQLGTFNFNLDFRNVLFRQNGVHFVTFNIDGTEITRQKFEIKTINEM
ncbi:hypothetical protein WMC37_03110 [Leuconostoc mesenteroides subsp. mesenteroides]|uniref:DUF6941 family protein n=1 Tax=Leuconostoc mesenteroides TaxID=1245 RepID=UPI0010AE204D|nr:hypothetical protein [Leuconostoc mesenteroides]TJY27392.1 hypothetical protein FCF26_09595 [Leuconostoc mesenteroides subsp. mesenteroides]